MAVKKKYTALGRGLDALISTEKVNTAGSGSICEIPVGQITPNPNQPRREFDPVALKELSDSIKELGIVQPITLRDQGDGTYLIIAGERRWRASQMAGLQTIPAYVRTVDDENMMEMALIENIQREDLNPVEEAMGYGALIDRFGLTQDQVAKQVGKNRSTVANMLRLLDLPVAVLDMLKAGDLTTGHARALLALDSEEKMINAASLIVERGMSVREVESLVKRLCEADAEPEEEKVHPQIKAQMKELERRAMSTLGRKVRISRSSRKKVVELTYDDDKDLEALLLMLCGQEIFSETV